MALDLGGLGIRDLRELLRQIQQTGVVPGSEKQREKEITEITNALKRAEAEQLQKVHAALMTLQNGAMQLTHGLGQMAQQVFSNPFQAGATGIGTAARATATGLQLLSIAFPQAAIGLGAMSAGLGVFAAGLESAVSVMTGLAQAASPTAWATLQESLQLAAVHLGSIFVPAVLLTAAVIQASIPYIASAMKYLADNFIELGKAALRVAQLIPGVPMGINALVWMNQNPLIPGLGFQALPNIAGFMAGAIQNMKLSTAGLAPAAISRPDAFQDALTKAAQGGELEGEIARQQLQNLEDANRRLQEIGQWLEKMFNKPGVR